MWLGRRRPGRHPTGLSDICRHVPFSSGYTIYPVGWGGLSAPQLHVPCWLLANMASACTTASHTGLGYTPEHPARRASASLTLSGLP